jgi:predicted nucleic acid-binding protein
MKDKEFEVDSTRVLQLVSQSNCSSYDCEFVASAEDLDVKLATFDKKICREFPDIALSPNSFFSD